MPSIFSTVRSILPFLTVAGWPSHSPTIRLCKDMECQQLFCSTKLSHQTFFCLSLQWTLYTATAYDRILILFSLQNILGHNVLALLTHFNTEDEDKIEMNILPFFCKMLIILYHLNLIPTPYCISICCQNEYFSKISHRFILYWDYLQISLLL